MGREKHRRQGDIRAETDRKKMKQRDREDREDRETERRRNKGTERP